MIGIGIWAFIIYIFFIIGWNLLLKRSIPNLGGKFNLSEGKK